MHIPRHMRHLGEDLEAVVSFPHTESILGDLRKTSSLPNSRAQGDLAAQRPRVGSGPTTPSPRVLNRVQESRLLDRMERQLDRDLRAVIARYPPNQ